jgi:hypothetical protein
MDPPKCRNLLGLHHFSIESNQTEFGYITFQNPNEIIDSSYELEIHSVLVSVCCMPKLTPINRSSPDAFAIQTQAAFT